jgi:hypothetical protein
MMHATPGFSFVLTVRDAQRVQVPVGLLAIAASDRQRLFIVGHAAS